MNPQKKKKSNQWQHSTAKSKSKPKSKSKIKINLTLHVLSRPEVTRLPQIVQTLSLKYDEKVLPSIGNEVLKAVVAQFNVDQLLIERPQVSALMETWLTERTRNFNIVLDHVAITHLSYGADLSRAVEQKQVAQQEAERSKFVVAKAEQERRAAIIRAEGESESVGEDDIEPHAVAPIPLKKREQEERAGRKREKRY